MKMISLFEFSINFTFHYFQELRVIIVEVLSDICHLDEEGVLAWNNLLDTVYHVLFECLDGK